MTYEDVKARIEAEASLPPGKRSQNVPCAYCVRGGNGDKSCSSGFKEKRYSKFMGCFSGELLPEAPGKKAKKCPARPMTLDEAIAHCDECVDATPCGQQHKQLAAWLRELRLLKDAKPPRNCDRFNSGDPRKDASDAWDAYDAWVASCNGKQPLNEFGWLFARVGGDEK